MSLFDKIMTLLSGDDEQHQFGSVINQTKKELNRETGYFVEFNLKDSKVYAEVVTAWDDKKKIRFIAWLVPAIHEYAGKRENWNTNDSGFKLNTIRQNYLMSLMRNKLIFEDEDVLTLYNLFSFYKLNSWTLFTGWPINLLLNQLEKQRKGQVISPVLNDVLVKIKQTLQALKDPYNDKDRLKMMDKIDSILFYKAEGGDSIKPARFLGKDDFANFANPLIENMVGQEKILWYTLIPMAQKANGSKPSKKYIDDSRQLVKEMGDEKFKKTIHLLFDFLVNLKEKEEQQVVQYNNGTSYTYSNFEFLSSVNADAIKGLIWICSAFHDNATIQGLAALADRCFRKIPGKGPAAPSVGNACLYALYKSRGLDGIGQLSRLKLRIKQGSTQTLIDKYLQAAATEQGVTVSEVEDMAVDDCGMINCSRDFVFDDYLARLIVTGVGKTTVNWYKPSGEQQKSVPSFVKEKHVAKLKKLKDTIKQVEQTLVAQRDRIDRLFRVDRKINWNSFQEYYLDHGIMCFLANHIIWNIYSADKVSQVIKLNNHWVNSDNEIVDISNAREVSIWHPVQATVDEIKKWRDFMIFHEVQQPLKQAYRELYILTDAEINTRKYSNRMAAHILRQHQFNSLAKTRGWRFSLMGAFDNGIDNDKASLLLPEHLLQAEYWISEVNAENEMNDTGIWNYVSTDQVRFIHTNTGEAVDLIDIPPIVFSEVMRDVDLFVGVASVGNDPAWRDNGGITAYRDYWTSFSFGELSEVARNRKEILEGLLPRLKIRDVATIKDRFLVIKGKLRTYKIHIGSTNILMEPNDQYLCIVPDRSQKSYTENLFLPFEGDNGLSIILSKAFLLADDEKISDITITMQINRK